MPFERQFFKQDHTGAINYEYAKKTFSLIVFYPIRFAQNREIVMISRLPFFCCLANLIFALPGAKKWFLPSRGREKPDMDILTIAFSCIVTLFGLITCDYSV